MRSAALADPSAPRSCTASKGATTLVRRTRRPGSGLQSESRVSSLSGRRHTLRPPDGETLLELSSFVRPHHVPGSPAAMSNELGLRNVCVEVDDLLRIVDDLAAAGYGLVGRTGAFEDTWRMTYVRGPEGVIVALALRIDA